MSSDKTTNGAPDGKIDSKNDTPKLSVVTDALSMVIKNVEARFKENSINRSSVSPLVYRVLLDVCTELETTRLQLKKHENKCVCRNGKMTSVCHTCANIARSSGWCERPECNDSEILEECTLCAGMGCLCTGECQTETCPRLGWLSSS